MNNQIIKVLIVNDSPVIAMVMKAIVETEPNMKVVGTVKTGSEAVWQNQKIAPDLILMDIHMPGMNGIEATKLIIQERPDTRILITTATITRNMSCIFEALKYGAIDYIKSPSLPYAPGSQIDKKTLKLAGERLIQKMSTVLKLSVADLMPNLSNLPNLPNLSNKNHLQNYLKNKEKENLKHPKNLSRIPIVGVGCSTGGPTTLVIFLNNLPKPFSGAILVCQHIEKGFDIDFASWVAFETQLNVKMAQSGTFPEANNIYIAPAGKNMAMLNNGMISIERASSEYLYVPNIDRLFYTMAKNIKHRACGIVMTGMGSDGALGAKAILDNKGEVFIQSEKSAIIDSMPKAARNLTGIKYSYSPPQLGLMAGNWMSKYWACFGVVD